MGSLKRNNDELILTKNFKEILLILYIFFITFYVYLSLLSKWEMH